MAIFEPIIHNPVKPEEVKPVTKPVVKTTTKTEGSK